MPSEIELVPVPDPLAPIPFDRLEVVGRLTEASNATFLVAVGEERAAAIYKPVRGEAPLWDFPRGTLARREVAAYRVSAEAGFDVVPYTTFVDGPFGPGSVQCWAEATDAGLVDVVSPDERKPDELPVFEGVDADERPLVVVHRDDARLRRLALFDVLANNADRKGSHIIGAAGVVFGVDHGLCFHHEPKLRTVLWGWAGAALTDGERALVEAAGAVAESALEGLSRDEAQAFTARAERLLVTGVMPFPQPGRPAIPWPPL